MTRVYHRYEKWEDFEAGMWRLVPRHEGDDLLAKAVEFTGDADLYGSYMMRVVREWPISCEHNLTNEGMNRLAWIGHSACAMAFRCPEYITRKAWGMLSDDQRNRANGVAATALASWLHRYLGDPRQMLLFDEIAA
jgi:hypothetical protein